MVPHEEVAFEIVLRVLYLYHWRSWFMAAGTLPSKVFSRNLIFIGTYLKFIWVLDAFGCWRVLASNAFRCTQMHLGRNSNAFRT